MLISCVWLWFTELILLNCLLRLLLSFLPQQISFPLFVAKDVRRDNWRHI